MARLRLGVGLMALAVACFVASLAAIAVSLSISTGWERVVIVSGSMSPALVPGDVVFADQIDQPVVPGTVLVFRDPASEGTLTHRVVEVLADGSYRTQGDANASPDSTPVPPDAVIGRGRVAVPVVGLPAAWLQSGRTGEALALLVALGLVAGGSRWAWPPTVPRAGARRRPWRTPHAGVVTAAGVSVLLLAGLGVHGILEPTRAAFTASTGNPASSLSVAAPLRLFLKTSAAGNVASQATLPLSTTAPTVATLPNYDTNRDALAGLTIEKNGTLTTTNLARIQKWAWTVPAGGVTFTSTTRVRLWSAMANFHTTRNGSVQMQAYDCNSTQATCAAIGSLATVTSTGGWSGGSSTWVSKDWSLGSLGTLAAGRVLQLRLIVLNASQSDMWFAYDTTAYPADLTAG